MLDCQPQVTGYQRFHEKCIDPLGLGFLGINGVTKARTENDGNVRADASEFAGQDFAGHVWHGLISDDQVEMLWSLAERFQGSEATGTDHSLIAQSLQRSLAYAGNGLLIIDKQNYPFANGERFVSAGYVVNHHVEPGQINFACRALF